MAVMRRKLYLALRQAGVDEAEPSEAAEQVADFRAQISGLTSDLPLIKALLGIIIAGIITLLARNFTI